MGRNYSLKESKYKEEIEHLQNLINIILKSVKHGIFGIDKEGKITFINPEGCNILGYKEDELIGKNSHDLFHHTKKDGTPYPIEECPTTIALESGNSQFVYDEVYWRKDGTSIPVEYYSTPIYQKGKIVGAVVSFNNISEQKYFSDLMMKSEKYSIIGELAAGIAHEIGNPLTSLKGFLQLFEAGTMPKREYIQIMQDELSRIEEISKDILILAKPDQLKFTKENIIAIIEHVVDLMSTDAFKKGIKIYKKFPEEKIEVCCIKNQIKQVFINIIKNALEAMNAGEIVISVRAGDDNVEIDIADNGPGISKDILGKIGEPFMTTKETGTGLGIVVTKRIIENHQGTLKIKSQLGEGTTVTISLPINLHKSE